MKQFLLILFSVIALQATAQQGLQMDFGEVDSSEVELQRRIEYNQLISGNFNTNALAYDLNLPKFNLQQEYQKRYGLSLEFLPTNNLLFTGLSSGPIGTYSPFYHNGTILSEQAFQLGDKLIIGGYSYGANNIHTTPNPNPKASYFDTYGSTMYMQYKVSKNFKIETRVSVGQRQGHPGF